MNTQRKYRQVEYNGLEVQHKDLPEIKNDEQAQAVAEVLFYTNSESVMLDSMKYENGKFAVKVKAHKTAGTHGCSDLRTTLFIESY